MSACGRCGTDNRPGARFCGVCGSPITVAAAGKGTPSGKGLAAPAVAPAPPEATAPPPGRARPAWLVPVSLAVIAIVAGGAFGLLLAGGGDDTTTATADTATGATSDDDDDGDEATTDGDQDEEPDPGGDGDEDPPATTEPAPDPEAPAVRSGTLYSNFAKLRTGPNINNPEIATLQREGAPLQIIGRHRNGWYEVRMDGNQGWLFGAFVNPPPSGHRIIQAYSGNIVLRNSAGVPLGITNESGPKALTTGVAGNLWRVILPDGNTAYVSQNDAFVAIG